MTNNSPKISIAVDAMGGDDGVKSTVPALLETAKRHPDVTFYCVGKLDKLANSFQNIKNVILIKADEEISMDDSPSYALRNKKQSSMRIAIDLVKSGSVSACVSSGNTGALMALSHFRLKMIPGISRPAIMSALPTSKKNKIVRVLDLGANVSSNARILYEFALVGSATAKAEGLANPKVGLLNVGHEQHKGHEEIKKANALLQQAAGINYCGYTEGNKIFTGELDVIVCDGFVGNILLKSCEGLISSIGKSIKSSCKNSPLKVVSALLAKHSFKKVLTHFHPDHNNGAILAGLNGIVVKSHGGASAAAFSSALERGILLSRGPGVEAEIQKLLLSNKEDECTQG